MHACNRPPQLTTCTSCSAERQPPLHFDFELVCSQPAISVHTTHTAWIPSARQAHRTAQVSESKPSPVGVLKQFDAAAKPLHHVPACMCHIIASNGTTHHHQLGTKCAPRPRFVEQSAAMRATGVGGFYFFPIFSSIFSSSIYFAVPLTGRGRRCKR